jgi:hypothetical protein
MLRAAEGGGVSGGAARVPSPRSEAYGERVRVRGGRLLDARCVTAHARGLPPLATPTRAPGPGPGLVM